MEWDARNPRHADGKIEEDLGTYGLSEQQINAQFAQYRERFSAYLRSACLPTRGCFMRPA
jgi:hypothetical protein